MPETITLEVFRYRPEEEQEPTFQSYEVPFRKDWVVLDALNHIKDEIDGSLSYRWSCRMGVCGSCGMMINGDAVLTCAAFLETYLPGPIRVEPLANFPVVRDLVIEMSDFMEKLNRVSPWIIPAEEKPVSEGEYLQTPDELEDYKPYSMCINCMLCYSACPVFGLEPGFIGPAAIAIAQRYNLDNRDEGNDDRNEIFRGEGSVYSCSFANECSEVCPKNVDPAAAVNQAKFGAVIDWAKGFVIPRGGE